jgi:hypothetical protein
VTAHPPGHVRQGDTAVRFAAATERDREATDVAGGDGENANLVPRGTSSGIGGPPPSAIPSQNTVPVADTSGAFVSSTRSAGSAGGADAIDVCAATRDARVGVAARRARPSAVKRSATNTAASAPPPAWMTVEQAAAFLSMQVVTIRRSLERNARATPEGGTISHWDGITARKLGRHWRVWLDLAWLAPGGRK